MLRLLKKHRKLLASVKIHFLTALAALRHILVFIFLKFGSAMEMVPFCCGQ